jgi:hypothetical protein
LYWFITELVSAPLFTSSNNILIIINVKLINLNMNKMRFKLVILALFAIALLPLDVSARGKTYEDIPSMAKS